MIREAERQRNLEQDSEVADLNRYLQTEFVREAERLANQIRILREDLNRETDSRSAEGDRLRDSIIELQENRESFLRSSRDSIAAFAAEIESEIEKERIDITTNLHRFQNEMRRDLELFESANQNLIESSRLKFANVLRNRRCQFSCRRALEDEQQALANEILQVRLEYEAKYKKLHEQLARESHFVPSPGTDFQTLASVYGDLEKELADRHSRVANERNLLSYEWANRITAETSRARKIETARPNSHARDQVRQSLSVQIKNLRASRSTDEMDLTDLLQTLRRPSRRDAIVDSAADAKSLRDRLSILNRESGAQIKEALEMTDHLISEAGALISKVQSDISREIDKVNQFSVMQANYHKKELHELEARWEREQQAIRQQLASLDHDFGIQRQNLRDRHALVSQDLSRQCDEERFAFTRDQTAFESDYRSAEDGLERQLASFRQSAKDTSDRLQADLATKIEILSEKLESIVHQNQKIRKCVQLNPKVGRPEDIEMIERLQAVHHAKKILHGNAMKELAACRAISAEQERQTGIPRGIPEVGSMQMNHRVSNPTFI
jgi:hypothetical protein